MIRGLGIEGGLPASGGSISSTMSIKTRRVIGSGGGGIGRYHIGH